MVSALQDEVAELDHVLMAPHTHLSAHQLALELLSLFGWEDGKVFYTDNGSTAVETSLKMLFQYSKLIGSERNIVLKPEGSYHGDTLSLTALSGIFNKEALE